MEEKRKGFLKQPLSKQLVIVMVAVLGIVGLIGVFNNSPVDMSKFKDFINSYGAAIFIPFTTAVALGRSVKNVTNNKNQQGVDGP